MPDLFCATSSASVVSFQKSRLSGQRQKRQDCPYPAGYGSAYAERPGKS